MVHFYFATKQKYSNGSLVHYYSAVLTPLNIGYIGQYTKQLFGNEVSVSLYKDPLKFLSDAKESKPDIVGLSLYYWNADLNRIIAEKIHALYGNDVVLVIGGPSTDTEEENLQMLFSGLKADAVVLEEGEVPFSEIVRARLSGGNALWANPIDGAVFFKDSTLVKGAPSVQTDLAILQSPYLSGLLDEFVQGKFKPLIQMSRYCPYTCAFCVAGKSRGKLRDFPMDMVKEEITFIAKSYVDRPHFMLDVADENFGILKRDAEIAQHIRKCSDEIGYPLSIFFYSDKRWTQTVRDVAVSLGKINQQGLLLSLQSENVETMKEISRKNLSDDDLDAAIAWAAERNITASTELIFGLPNETLDSFITSLDNCARRGFDSVVCHSLFLMAGVPLNNKEMRQKYKTETKFRILSTNYCSVDGEFSVEHEEIVVASNTFSFDDFLVIRKLNFLFYSAFTLNFCRWFFQFIQSKGISVCKFFSDFMNPSLDVQWPQGYLDFIADFNREINAELFDTREELEQHAKELFEKNGNQVAAPTRLNVLFGARLIYLEKQWVGTVLMQHLKKYLDTDSDSSIKETVSFVLKLCDRERVDLRNLEVPQPLLAKYDLLGWRREKFKKTLESFPIEPQMITFNMEPKAIKVIEGFKKDFCLQEDKDFYYNAMDFIVPRSDLLYGISCPSQQEKMEEA